VQIRPAFGGNIMATIICPRTLPQMATVREGIVKVAEKVGKKGVAKRIPVSLKEKKLMELLSRVSVKEEEVRLQEAAVILSGGRGMQNKENFSLLFELASHLGAAVGASRAVVDQEWVGVQHQVGQTGVIVKPKLYTAFGISGAIQHIVGIKDAECIVAVNKDPDAPIMSVADYRFVADAVQVVKNLLQLCKEET
jgi:electron transfer flavoprotein alpha subunit